ncbi:hypothetical protein JW897_07085 [Chromobacterium alkanivorans]|uniref:STM3941 family protein n=1 Tax=Chromobacterium alkanivorans TaxID=1071719 RepID=UPI00196891BB|nr:STM3941 family protein [Chromobacterium alkanivorans]MBN3003499.1 hypothetical protein [Chromobacterium alkanivorans]
MSAMDEIRIEFGGGKVLLLIVAGLAFVAVGYAMWTAPDTEVSLVRRYGAGGAAMVFFGACCLLGLRQCLQRKPALVFNAQGLSDHSSQIAVGLIPWADIVGWEVSAGRGQQFLIIKVRAPGKYLSRLGPVARLFSHFNFICYGSPIAISSTALQASFDDLLVLLGRYHQRYSSAPAGWL